MSKLKQMFIDAYEKRKAEGYFDKEHEEDHSAEIQEKLIKANLSYSSLEEYDKHKTEGTLVKSDMLKYLRDYKDGWMYIVSPSGSGKTLAVNACARHIIRTQRKSFLYVRKFKELVEAINNKEDSEYRLLGYDIVILDDFGKGKMDSEHYSSIIDDIIDRFYVRADRAFWIIGDLPITRIHEKLHKDYRDQVIYRITEKCGDQIKGFDLENLRR